MNTSKPFVKLTDADPVDTNAPVRLLLIFSKGDYAHALRCYEEALAWLIRTGLAVHQGIRGTIGRPHHRRCPSSERIVPPWLLRVTGWNVSVEIGCMNESVAQMVLGLVPLPPNATLVRKEEDLNVEEKAFSRN